MENKSGLRSCYITFTNYLFDSKINSYYFVFSAFKAFIGREKFEAKSWKDETKLKLKEADWQI